MLKGIAEYVDININIDLYKVIFDYIAKDNFNRFGKTQWYSYALEVNYSGVDSGLSKVFEPILKDQYKVHPYMQKRSTGFNFSNSPEKDLFIHTDIDLNTKHPKHFNLIIPIFGTAVISYYETREDEVFLPEKNAHGYAYYHEFKAQAYTEDLQATPRFEKFLAERKIGEIIVDKPILIETEIMHRVVITEAPRCAWVTRWNNIPPEWTFEKWKDRVESML